MKRKAVAVAVYLGSSALGILIASLLIQGFTVTPLGFVVAVVVFSVAQSILTPIIEKAVTEHAAALVSGVGLISTFAALFVANLIAGGLRIWNLSAWISSTLIIWLVTALSAWLLPMLVSKLGVGND